MKACIKLTDTSTGCELFKLVPSLKRAIQTMTKDPSDVLSLSIKYIHLSVHIFLKLLINLHPMSHINTSLIYHTIQAIKLGF